MLWSILKNSTMMGISVSISKPLMIQPRKLNADFLFPGLVRIIRPTRSIRNMLHAQKYTRSSSLISLFVSSNPNSSTPPTMTHNAPRLAIKENAINAMSTYGATYFL